MRFSIFKLVALATAFQTVVSTPVKRHLSSRHVVSTTTTADGQHLDWIIPESQVDGKLAVPPPNPPQKRSHLEMRARIQARVDSDPGRQGPPGTVPVLRSNASSVAPKRLPSPEDHGSGNRQFRTSESNSGSNSGSSSNAGQHWYTSTAQKVNNHGGKATFSLYKSFTQNSADFSLLQTAVIRSSPTQQTVEGGWISYPDQIAEPHLFTFYTTNAYSQNGDNIGGWNTDVKGWVQVDSQLYPGVTFSPLASNGGAQYDVEIGYFLSDNNWWLWCTDRYIGYYPASLFSAAEHNSAQNSLADHSDTINFYGEIFNSQEALTTTDMGSGEFPSTGFGKSAYLRNIMVYDTTGRAENYNGDDQLIISDKTRYDIVTQWNSATTWGSYFYLGGPGAGGKIDA